MGSAITLGTCSGLNARISNRQCTINRTNPLLPCKKCSGLSDIQIMAYQVSSPAPTDRPSHGKKPGAKRAQLGQKLAPERVTREVTKASAEDADKIKDSKPAPHKKLTAPRNRVDPTSTIAANRPQSVPATVAVAQDQQMPTAAKQTGKKKTKTVKYPFTPEMNEIIRETYRTATGKSQVADLAKKMGIPRWAVSKQARNIGAYEMKVKEPNWGEGDLSILKENAHKSPERIQIDLKKAGYKRSIAGIILKRKRLNLLSNLDGLSATTLAGYFGVDIKCITGWIDKEWLKAEKRGTNRTEKQGGDQWYILKTEVKQFIAEYIGVIDIRKVDKFWLRDIMLGENMDGTTIQAVDASPTKKIFVSRAEKKEVVDNMKSSIESSAASTNINDSFTKMAGSSQDIPETSLNISLIKFVTKLSELWNSTGQKNIIAAIKAADSKTSPQLLPEQVKLFFDALEMVITEVETSAQQINLHHLYRDRALFYLYYAADFSVSDVLALNVTSFGADPDHPEYGEFGGYLVKMKDSPDKDPDFWLVPMHAFSAAGERMSWYASRVRPCYDDTENIALFLGAGIKRERLQYPEFESRFQYYLLRAGLDGKTLTPGSLRRSVEDKYLGIFFDQPPLTESPIGLISMPHGGIGGIQHQVVASSRDIEQNEGPRRSVDEHNKPITLNFVTDRDRELLSTLESRAEMNRRSVSNEILVLLEEFLAGGHITSSGEIVAQNENITFPIGPAVSAVHPSTQSRALTHSTGGMPQLNGHPPETQKDNLPQIVERFDIAITLAEELPPRELRPLQRDKALFVIFHGCHLSAAELLKLNVEFQPDPLHHPQVSEILCWYVNEVRPYFMAKAAPGENALFLSDRGSRLQLPAFTVRLQKANQLIGIDLKELAPSMVMFRPTPAGGVVEVAPGIDAPTVDIEPEEHHGDLDSAVANNRILSYLHSRAQHFAPSRRKGNVWLADIGNKLMAALNARQIPFRLVDGYPPVLTPNAGVFRIQGNKNVTVPIIESKVQEIFTTEGMRIIAVSPEPGCLRLTVARPHRETLHTETALRDFFIQHPGAAAEEKLLVGIREEDGQPLVLNPYEQPHSLLAGSTGSGKSILLQNIILSIAISRSPEESKIFLIDPKHGVDYEPLERLPHIRMGSEETISDPDAAIDLFEQAVEEMERRYRLFRKAGHGVNNIQSYRRITGKPLPTWWLIHDEFADWMQTKKYRDNIPQLVNRLSGKARAVGIFMVFAASRPDHTVLPNLMRDQMGNRLILKVQSSGTSEIALGEKGAEKLLGKGHMLAKLGGNSEAVFAQVPFIDPVHGIPQLVDEICAYYSDNGDGSKGTASARRKKRSQKAEEDSEESSTVLPKRKYRRRQTIPSPSECVIE